MAAHPSAIPRLADMLQAMERIAEITAHETLATFESDWRSKWLVERAIEIISEASRHLPEALKARHKDIPWRKVAGIGNVLRHDYENIAAPVIWALAKDELAALEKACRDELALAQNSTPFPPHPK